MRAEGDDRTSLPSEITQLLQAAHGGRVDAVERLFPLLYDELRRVARSMLGPERSAHTLQATALVHEAWMRLARQDSVGFEHRAQFFSAAATTMRRVLVDHARARRRDKRGGGVTPEPLDETLATFEQSCGDMLELEGALDSLAILDARKAKLVELRFFAGLDMQESAQILAISKRQAEREWTTARAFLKRHLSRVGNG